MSIFSRVCNSKALDSFNCELFKCYEFMKGRIGSMLSRTKYVKCFRVETSCYRLVLRLKFILTVELLYDQAESDFVNVRQKCGPLPPGYAVNLNKLSLIALFIKMLYGVWSSLQPDQETNRSPRRMQSALQPGTMTGRRSETFEDL